MRKLWAWFSSPEDPNDKAMNVLKRLGALLPILVVVVGAISWTVASVANNDPTPNQPSNPQSSTTRPTSDAEVASGEQPSVSLPPAGSYIGRAAEQVRRELEPLGVAVKLSEQEVSGHQPGTVIDQSVAPGGALTGGITLTVARGQALVPINEVVLTKFEEETGDWFEGPITIDGQSFDKGHFVRVPHYRSGDLQYEAGFVLSSRYRRFLVRVGVLDNAERKGPFPVRVTADAGDRVLLEQDVSLGQPIDLDLDVTGLARVTVMFTLPGFSGTNVGIGEAKGIQIP